MHILIFVELSLGSVERFNSAGSVTEVILKWTAVGGEEELGDVYEPT